MMATSWNRIYSTSEYNMLTIEQKIERIEDIYSESYEEEEPSYEKVHLYDKEYARRIRKKNKERYEHINKRRNHVV